MNIYFMAKYIKIYVLISLHCNITSSQIPKISNDVIAVSINTSHWNSCHSKQYNKTKKKKANNSTTKITLKINKFNLKLINKETKKELFKKRIISQTERNETFSFLKKSFASTG